MNDPFQNSDNVNRFLWAAELLLGAGPVRTAETVLDVCVLAGILKTGDEAVEKPQPVQTKAVAADVAPGAATADATRPIAPLDPESVGEIVGQFRRRADSARHAAVSE